MKRITGITLLVITLAFVPLSFASAAGTGIWEGTQCAENSLTGGPVDPCDFCDGLQVAANIIDFLLKFAAVAAVIMIVAGALIMMFSGGSEERFATGKRAITNAIIGLAIGLVAWTFVNTVLQFLSGSPSLPWNEIRCID